MWSLKREKSSILHSNVGIQDFKKMRKIAETTKCRVRIEKKRGIPFFLHRYKKRKFFVVCLIIVILAIILASNFVWNIEITGNQSVKAEEIMVSINKSGLEIGKWKKNLDLKKVINDIRLDRADIAWVGIEIKGTNAIVKIVEADEKPNIVDETKYCNIVAQKDGIIEKVDANNGTILVQPGEVVKRGSILVGGWIEGKYTGTRYVHANGEVKAKVWYTKKIKKNKKQKIREKTGREEKKYSVAIQNFKINLYKGLSKFENYDTIGTSKKVQIFSNFYIPVEITEYHNYEVKEEVVEYEIEEIKQQAKEEAEEELAKEIGEKQILDKNYLFHEEAEFVEAEVTYEVLENIGTEEEIVF